MTERRRPFDAALVCAGFAACAAGLVLHRLWLDVPWPRVADQIILLLASIALAAAVRRIARTSWATALAGVWFAALLFFAGVPAVLATLLLGAAALAVGGIVTRDGPPVIALACGLAVIGGVDGWLLTLPVHRWFVYAPLLLALCMLRRRALVAALTQARDGWRSAVAASPRGAAFAIALCGVASSAAWLPTALADDVNYHLGLPSQLLRHGRYVPDLANQIWAAAPWLGDTLQGLVAVLARGEARGALDLLWFVLAAGATWTLTARFASARMAWLCVALFASLPLSAGLLGSMQTELPALALLLALAVAIVQPGEAAQRASLAIGVLAGALVALKFSHAVAALVMLLWALLRRGRPDLRGLVAGATAFLVVAGSSYAQAAWLSGNPMFPLFNNVFHSPLFDARQLDDARWHAGFGASLPWRMTFSTDDYLEGWRGAFGFAWLALAGAWLLALRDARTRGLALAASAILLLPLVPMQYARYAFPGLVLLLVPLVAACAGALGERRAAFALAALCALDVAFLANANWLQHTNALRVLVRTHGDAMAVFERYAPERALIARLRVRDDGESVVLALDPAVPAIAELGRRGRSVAWYAPKLEGERIAADADASGARWVDLIRGVDARWLLLRPANLDTVQRAALDRLGAKREEVVGNAELWSVPAAEIAQ